MTAVDGVTVGRIVDAASVAEVQETVHAGRTIVATGLGGHLDVGAPPRAVETLLRLDRLARVVVHEAHDMTVTVEAGCPLDVLARTLDAAGQWLPIDPPSFERTTVGGLVAANLAGPLRASQGTVRDLLIGIAVVGTDGALVRGGGRVVKNVAGYDLPKLHVGALGTLGIVVEATFKVRPRPEREAAVVFRTPTPAELALVVRDALEPLWLEAGMLPDGPGVAVGIAGIAPEVAAARRTLESFARSSGVQLEWIDDGARLRCEIADFVVAPAAAVLRASVLPADLPWATARVAEVAGAVPALAHVASGVVHARLDDVAAVARVVERLRPEIESRGGFLVVERARPHVKAGLDVWGNAGEGLALMRGVKAALDPRGVFAPGRFVGGI